MKRFLFIFKAYVLYPKIKKGLGFKPRPIIRLQFHFVFRRIQSLQLLLPTHPCLPLALPAVLGRPFHGLSPLPFRFLTSAVSAFFRPPQFWILTTQPLFFLSNLPGLASQWLFRCPVPLSLPRFPPYLRPDFSCLPSGFLYSASLLVSFRSSLLRSHSRSTGACLPFLLPAFSASGLLSFVRSPSVSSYSAFCSSFPSLPGLASQWLFRCTISASASLAFPVLSNPVSRVFFPGSCTRLSVRFLSSFPVSLPQPFHRCFPYAFAFGLSPCSKLSFVRFRSVLTTQPSALSFPFFPFSPGGGSHGAYFLFRPACCHAVLPIPVLSFLQFLSPSAVSLHRSYHSAPTLAVDFPWLTL